MFELPLIQISATARAGLGQWMAEAVATFGLLLTIFGCLAGAPCRIPYAVGLYITAAYWFTASTSFANPAVTNRARRCPIRSPAFRRLCVRLHRGATHWRAGRDAAFRLAVAIAQMQSDA